MTGAPRVFSPKEQGAGRFFGERRDHKQENEQDTEKNLRLRISGQLRRSRYGNAPPDTPLAGHGDGSTSHPRMEPRTGTSVYPHAGPRRHHPCPA